jgi:deazaflavin-dependent oxidoreductase (nitroreductase family)
VDKGLVVGNDSAVLSSMRSRLTRKRAIAHRAVLQATGGRVGGRLGGMPVIVLTTTGRRTGRLRSVAVNAPIDDDDRVVVVASDGGAARDPNWYRNLCRFPEVTVLRRTRRQRMRARVADPRERDELWPLVTARNGVYDRYQKATARQIPLVILEPSEV